MHKQFLQQFSGSIRQPLAEISRASASWQRIAEVANKKIAETAELSKFHESWKLRFEADQIRAAHLNAISAISMNQIARRISITESLFARIDFDAISHAHSAPNVHTSLFQSIARLASAFEKFAQSVPAPADFAGLPDFVVPSAARELFVSGYTLNVLQVDGEDYVLDASITDHVRDVEAESAEGLLLLGEFDPDLARAYVGAREAILSSNPDHARHVLSSLRELWKHLLRRLAPDDEVVLWVPDKSLLHDRKPTRRARVLYICRHIDHPPLSEFIDKDARALVTLIEFFHRVHELDIQMSDEQLNALILRTESWLTYILRIRKEGS